MNTYVILSLIFILTIKFTREYNVRDLNEEAYTSITKSDEKWIVLFYVNTLITVVIIHSLIFTII